MRGVRGGVARLTPERVYFCPYCENSPPLARDWEDEMIGTADAYAPPEERFRQIQPPLQAYATVRVHRCPQCSRTWDRHGKPRFVGPAAKGAL